MAVKDWTNRDILLLSVYLMIAFGDAVEIYLPGVITQNVSCELGFSKNKEGFLATVLYLTLALVLFVSGSISDRFGRRVILLTSLYTSILFTILCALVPNYWTLLLSRALTGVCVGLNMSTSGVFFAEEIDDNKKFALGAFLGITIFAAGGGWVAILGWMMLESMGWRFFVLCTSIPLFIPPIYLLHFELGSEKDYSENDYKALKKAEDEENDIKEETLTKKEILSRVIKVSIFGFINAYQGFGNILLLPALIRGFKIQENSTSSYCDVALQKEDMLILALVSGGLNILGRLAGFLLNERIRFKVLQPILAVLTVLCYTILLHPSLSMVTIVAAMGLIKFISAMMVLERSLMSFDPNYLGKDTLAKASAVIGGIAVIGGFVGNTMVEFLTIRITVIVGIVFSALEVIVLYNITPRKYV